MLRYWLSLACIFMLLASRAAISAERERITLQPGDALPAAMLNEIPKQFRDQLVCVEFNSVSQVRWAYEEPGLINRNEFDLPWTGMPTFYFVDTAHYPERDVEWVKSNLAAPVHVTPVYIDSVSLSSFPQHLLVFNGRISMMGDFGRSEVMQVWSGWGGGVRVEAVRPLTTPNVERSKMGPMLAEPVTYEFDLKFDWFPHYATSEGYGEPPQDLEVTLEPFFNVRMGEGYGNSKGESVVWKVDGEATRTIKLSFPAGAGLIGVNIRHEQNGQDLSRLHLIHLPQPAKDTPAS